MRTRCARTPEVRGLASGDSGPVLSVAGCKIHFMTDVTTPQPSHRDRLLLSSACGLLAAACGLLAAARNRDDAGEAVAEQVDLALAALGDLVGLAEPSEALCPVGQILEDAVGLLGQVSPELGEDDPVFTSREAVNEAISCWEFEGPYGGDGDDLRDWRDCPDSAWSQVADEHGVTVWELHWFCEQNNLELDDLRWEPAAFIAWVSGYAAERRAFLQLSNSATWPDH